MKKLLNKRGSVLFLVVVVMALLLVAASATYYVVRNQHMSANTHYASEQSYQTALSVSDTVSDYIDSFVGAILDSGTDISSFSDSMVGKMLSLPVYASMGSDSFKSEIDLVDLGMGTAEVNITKVKSEADPTTGNNVHTFEIATTAEVNGETSVIALQKEIVTGPTEYFTRFLTSTGGRPEDSIIGSHTILSDAYFENDYTALGIGTTNIRDSIYCSGALHDKGIAYDNTNPPAEIVVSENFYSDSVSHGGFYVGNIYVGGDFITNKPFEVTNEVYVLGNLENTAVTSQAATTFYVNKNCIINAQTPNATYYINGDLHIYDKNNKGTYYVNGDVYIYFDCGNNPGNPRGFINEIQYNGSLMDTGYTFVEAEWPNIYHVDDPPSAFTDVENVKNYINSSTSRQSYTDWDAEGYFTKALRATAMEATIDDPSTDGVEQIGDNEYWTPGYMVNIDRNAILHPAQDLSGGQRAYITIDATAQDIYILLEPGVDDPADQYSFAYGGGPVTVLVKGSHSVVFIVPENVSFYTNMASFIGHIDLAMALTGADETSLYENYSNGIRVGDLQNGDAMASKMAGFLEDEYKDGEFVATVLDRDAIGGSYDVHNNIFLVTKGTTNSITFDPLSTFCGYLYAPKALMDASGSGGGGLGFVGGMIVGSYQYQCAQNVLSFTTPYDYYGNYPGGPTDIVKYLISFANNNGGDGGDVDAVSLQKIRNLGYQ